MPPSVRPDGRPSRGVREIGSDNCRTARFRAVGSQRGALTQDVRSVVPTSIGWPIRPVLDRARPCECHATIARVTAVAVGVCLSIGTVHGQNTSGWHHATSGVERAIRQLATAPNIHNTPLSPRLLINSESMLQLPIMPSGRDRRVVVVEARGTVLELNPKYSNHPKTKGAFFPQQCDQSPKAILKVWHLGSLRN